MACINQKSCILRFELQFDFNTKLDDCAELEDSCICHKDFDILFIEMYPYIHLNKSTNESHGLLQGK